MEKKTYLCKQNKNKTMRKVLSLILLALLPIVASADAVEIDGIYYNLIVKAKQAEVTSNPNKYSGSVNIPASVTYEGKEYGVTSIGSSAFSKCSGLTFITIGNSVTSIGTWAFSNCSGLTSVTIPNSVTSIGTWAFSNCSGLTSINIPNSVTSIGESAFGGCSGLTSVTIPNSVTSIGNHAFESCHGLTSVTIPNSVTSIGDYAFSGCSGLTSVTIGNSVTSIGNRAFYECSGLTSVIIPESVTSIGGSAFYGCSGLTSVIIPESVRSIGQSAFYNCYNLTSVTIPNSVTSIGYDAFTSCIGLTSVTIGNSVTSIGDYAFSRCSGLTSITIPNSVTSIGSYAFKYCSSLTSVTIGSSVTSIGSNAFANCPELADVYCYSEDVPCIDDIYGYYTTNLFDGSYIEYATLHVPASSIEQYKATEPWSGFGKIVPIDGDIPDPPKPETCATPTISYKNGELAFSCETEGVQFISTIADNDIKTYYSDKIDLGVTYTITVYATKAGYENSEVATATLCWIDVEPQTEGITDEDAVTEVKAVPVLIQTQGGNITIQGAAEGTPIAVYDISGKQYGSTISEKDRATISTSLQPGTIAIVKIGEKSVKIAMRE